MTSSEGWNMFAVQEPDGTLGAFTLRHEDSARLLPMYEEGSVVIPVRVTIRTESALVPKARRARKRPSRADRRNQATAALGRAIASLDAFDDLSVEDAKSELESLKEELESWKENLPENLQSSSKADELDQAVDGLNDAIGALEEVDLQDVRDKIQEALDAADNVEFPRMY